MADTEYGWIEVKGLDPKEEYNIQVHVQGYDGNTTAFLNEKGVAALLVELEEASSRMKKHREMLVEEGE